MTITEALRVADNQPMPGFADTPEGEALSVLAAEIRAQAQRHEQDIDAAARRGWECAKVSYTIADPTTAIARYEAELDKEHHEDPA